MSAKHKRVLHWDDERDLGHRIIIVTLRRGWAYWPHPDEAQAEHVKGFDTVRAALAGVRGSKPCTCRRCTHGDGD